MEGKERYELVEEDFSYAIVDNEEHKTYQQDCFDFGNICDLLNQQDKRIKELEEELENYKLCRCVDCSTECEKGLETSINELEKENQQLKQSQKHLAIEQLEKVEEILWNSQDIGNVIDNDKFLEKLNYLIKSLKGE